MDKQRQLAWSWELHSPSGLLPLEAKGKKVQTPNPQLAVLSHLSLSQLPLGQSRELG